MLFFLAVLVLGCVSLDLAVSGDSDFAGSREAWSLDLEGLCRSALGSRVESDFERPFVQKVLSEALSIVKARFSLFLPKQSRCFQRCLSGLLRASFAHQRCSFLTLTSGVGFDVSRLADCFQALRKRVEHKFGFLMQYLMVRTSEGNGVLHVIFVAPEFLPKRWISASWLDITHGVSRIIRIFEVRLGRKADCKRMARYMTQYVAGQVSFERFSYSWSWIFKGAVRVWRSLVSVHGLHEAISRFEWILSFPIVKVVQGAFDVVGSLILSGVPHRVLGG